MSALYHRPDINLPLDQCHVLSILRRVELMARAKITNEDRQRLVDAFEDGSDWQELARQLNIKIESARSIIRVWVREGRVERKPMGGPKRQKATAEMKEAILTLVLQNQFITLRSLNQKLREELPHCPHISDSTVARILDGHLITCKLAGKEADIPHERNLPRILVARQQYAQFFTNLGIRDHVIYVDESGYNVFTRRSIGRARRGERVQRQVCGSRGRNVVLILAISPTLGVVHHWLRQMTVTRATFQEYLNELIEKASNLLPEDEHCTIIYDGARPHLRMTVPQNFANRFVLRILPAYSPMLNPTEQAHSCFKAAVKRQLVRPEVSTEIQDAANRRQAEGLTLCNWRARILSRVGEEALNELTPQKCQNWCARVLRYMQACADGAPILQ